MAQQSTTNSIDELTDDTLMTLMDYPEGYYQSPVESKELLREVDFPEVVEEMTPPMIILIEDVCLKVVQEDFPEQRPMVLLVEVILIRLLEDPEIWAGLEVLVAWVVRAVLVVPVVHLTILWTAPSAWSEFLNSDKQTSILQLLLDAELCKHSLISAWKNYGYMSDIQKGTRKDTTPASVPDQDDPDYVEAESDKEVEETKDSHIANLAQGKGKGKDRPKTQWLKGGVFKGNLFTKQDWKKNIIPPTHGNCFVCDSEYHYAQECPLYGEWEALTNANMIDMVVEQSVQELDTREYYTAFVAMHAASLYSGVNLLPKHKVLTLRFSTPMAGQQGNNPFNWNYCRCIMHEKKLKA
ncbi:hypothetical protein C8J56DRAFT_886837 [Mycena floridula]|nr:hypothetical protein C8J56DRAFT_886837 [Mycena floridula]